MLDQILEGFIGQALAVGPGRVAENASQHVRAGRLDLPQRGLNSHADVFRNLAHILPVRSLWDLEAMVLGELGVGEIAIGIGQCRLIFLIPDIRDALEERGAGRCRS